MTTLIISRKVSKINLSVDGKGTSNGVPLQPIEVDPLRTGSSVYNPTREIYSPLSLTAYDFENLNNEDKVFSNEIPSDISYNPTFYLHLEIRRSVENQLLLRVDELTKF